MKYSISIFLESKDDVIRKIEIDSKCSLFELHNFIIECFDLQKNELASFYITDQELEIIEEIPLFSFEENNNRNMEDTELESILNSNNNKLIYVYDYMLMWRFLVELTNDVGEIKEKKCISSIGVMPKDAPEVNFTANTEDKYNEDSYEDEYNQDDESY
ncbi:MAG: hypothetical protein P8J77_05625 [Flavobacteriales bacterium]|jgi:hypothetical protein|nr:hypothetical protein [Flavobacteriales bacterium]